LVLTYKCTHRNTPHQKSKACAHAPSIIQQNLCWMRRTMQASMTWHVKTRPMVRVHPLCTTIYAHCFGGRVRSTCHMPRQRFKQNAACSTHTHTCTHTHAHRQTRRHKHMRTHTHTNTHKYTICSAPDAEPEVAAVTTWKAEPLEAA